MNTENIKHIFQSQFDYRIYCNEIVRNIFGCTDINAQPELLDTSSEGDRSHYVGRMSDAEGRELGFSIPEWQRAAMSAASVWDFAN